MTTYPGGIRIDRAQVTLQAHAVSSADGLCVACRVPGPCPALEAAVRVFTASHRLPGGRRARRARNWWVPAGWVSAGGWRGRVDMPTAAVRAGVTVFVGVAASVQFRWERGVQLSDHSVQERDSYVGWKWVDDYQFDRLWEAIERRSLFVQVALLLPPGIAPARVGSRLVGRAPLRSARLAPWARVLAAFTHADRLARQRRRHLLADTQRHRQRFWIAGGAVSASGNAGGATVTRCRVVGGEHRWGLAGHRDDRSA